MDKQCIHCGRSIPPEFTKCFQCAMKKPVKHTFKEWKPVRNDFETFPVSQQSETYKNLEFNITKATCVMDWDNDWAEAYIHNRIEMALIANNKEQFMYWTGKLKAEGII